MKGFRFSMLVVTLALTETAPLALSPRSAQALDPGSFSVTPAQPVPPPTFQPTNPNPTVPNPTIPSNPSLPFEPLPTNPVFPTVKIKYYGPEQELCASSSGAVVAREACRASELTLDPTALKICANTAGALSMVGPRCPRGSTEVDLRAVRDSSPPTWFGSLSGPPVFQVTPPFNPPINPIFPIANPPIPIAPAKVLCKRKARLSLRQECTQNESTIHPSALVACAKRSGSVSMQGGSCKKRETHLDLRAVRGPASNPIGIGALVGLVPSLADLVSEYPNG